MLSTISTLAAYATAVGWLVCAALRFFDADDVGAERALILFTTMLLVARTMSR